ncbi:hypothetical protein ACFV7Q_26560 [Streptomyces sp. NPDC059851]|uniref:hypothetical protein n=1 Tax=Streptomyces sp. NPDC059851 TaxID=3346971 RepID=UPI003660A81A
MHRLALLAVGVAGLTALATAPAAAAPPVGAAATETVTSCGNSALQAGLATRLCADVTGDVVEFYGRVSLAGPPSPGSPAPAPKELFTTLSAAVVGGTSFDTQERRVIFTSTTLDVHGLAATAPCGSTVRGTFGVASYPWAARPVVHEVTITC